MMNVGSEKRLVAAAKQAMVLLNPEWPAYAALKGALEAAQKPVAVVRKRKIQRACDGPESGAKLGDARDEGGIIWRLMLERSCKACGHDSTDHKPENRAMPLKDWRDRHAMTQYRTVQVCACGCEDYQPRQGMKPNICVEAVKLEKERERLRYCACGHWADSHKKDELENLLACGASRCKCDHFHYAAPSDAAAAA